MKWNDEAKIKVWEISLIWVILWINMMLIIVAIFGLQYIATYGIFN